MKVNGESNVYQTNRSNLGTSRKQPHP